MYMLYFVFTCLLVRGKAMNMNDRLVGRVIHMETLIERGRYMMDNDYHDAEGSIYFYVDLLAERDTYYTPRSQYMVTKCGGGSYICLESINNRDFYLKAGYPAGGTKHTVKLSKSVYTEDDETLHWTIHCSDELLNSCYFLPRRFESASPIWYMITDNWGGGGHGGGHYDSTLGDALVSEAYWRVLAPNPSDYFRTIYTNDNTGPVDQSVTISIGYGVSQTHETTSTFTSSVSAEIGGSFRAFSASASSTIENSWATTDSKTFNLEVKIDHKLTIPSRKRLIFQQLTGKYADQFVVADQYYKEIVEDLGTGKKHVRYGRVEELKKNKGKAEL